MGCRDTCARTVTLIITHDCNLNCTYCYEKYKSKKHMTLDMAKDIIAKEFAFCSQSAIYNHLCIDFMGGEPFIEFSLMRDLSEWIWNNKWPISYTIFVTTNGTLFTDDIKSWLEINRHRFKIGMSFDGTPSMQDINRNNTSKKFSIDFFHRVYPEQLCKMTVSPDTLRTLSEGVIYLHTHGFNFTANLGHGLIWRDEDYIIYEKELFSLAKFYLKNPQYNRIALLDIGMRAIRLSGVPEKTCGTGTSMISYDIDGNTYPCPVFSPLTMGDDNAKILCNLDFDDPNNYIDKRCIGCILHHICSTCYAFNYKISGNIAHREECYCKLMHISAKIYTWFKTEEIKNKINNNIELSYDDIQEAAGITYAYEHGFPDCLKKLNI